MSTFNVTNVRPISALKGCSIFRTKDGSRLYASADGNPATVTAIFSEKIQSKEDITANTKIGTFKTTSGEDVDVVYNEGKTAEFTL